MIVATMSNNFDQLDKQQLERRRKIKEMEVEQRRLYQSRECSVLFKSNQILKKNFQTSTILINSIVSSSHSGFSRSSSFRSQSESDTVSLPSIGTARESTMASASSLGSLTHVTTETNRARKGGTRGLR